MMRRPYNPGRRKRCVGIAWKVGRRVRIKSPAFGYGGKIGVIQRVGAQHVYVLIPKGRKVVASRWHPNGGLPFEESKGWHDDEVAYPPECLRLI